MNSNLRRFLAMIVFSAMAAVFLAACAKPPKLTEGGNQVQYVENLEIIRDKLEDPAKCRFIAYLEVEADVAVGLTESRMKNEQRRRLVRARNLAAENDANVIVSDGELSGKSQKFKAYKCL